MGKNRQSLVPVFFIISYIALAIFASFYTYLYIQNKNLRASIAALQQNVMSSLDEDRRYQELQKTTSKLEDDVMGFLEWKFVVKEQTAQASLRLRQAQGRIKELKKDKALLNLFYYNLGLSSILAQDYNGAVTAFEKAYEYDRKDALTCYDLGMLYSLMGGNDKKARQYYQKYLELDPTGTYADGVRSRLKGLPSEKRKGE